MNARTSPALDAATTVIPAPVTLSELARDALEAANNDTAAAAKTLVARVIQDPMLLRHVIEEAVRVAVSTQVNTALRSDRASILRSVTAPPANKPRLDGAAIQAVLMRNLLDFPLAGGLLLRDASKSDVLDQVERYSKQAADMNHKARWLSRVADAIPAKKRVGQVMTAEQLNAIYDEESNNGRD